MSEEHIHNSGMDCESDPDHCVACCRKYLAAKEVELAKCKESLKFCIGWMEPVLEGFSIAKDTSAYRGFLKAKEALTPPSPGGEK